MKNKTIVLGVSASVAAYKSAQLVSEFKKKGITVHVVMTKNSTEFITPLTMQVLSGNPVHTDTMKEAAADKVNHIALAQNCDLVLIAPATANIIGKLSNGIADDMLTTVCMAVPIDTPKIIAPAMNTKMYEQPVTVDNLNKLKSYGYEEIKPISEMLACGDVGIGALAPVTEIVDYVVDKLSIQNA
ncbi:phosphopantothenoylcysteine decarboxylase [Vagococcus coleopterorum]|uniref:Phosphopantothenoylcysteine decarboxylase n=1 Tax=Vagococcus coleopterorum TaxID=2714946 RepID=A0A6G8AM05_9ENTE|nr:flavoprotein [Vagococcus coleopterorum]QIL46027.1 phosphopantothenoylcysteine decarboxylase [Vagococcus coleopterorum]